MLKDEFAEGVDDELAVAPFIAFCFGARPSSVGPSPTYLAIAVPKVPWAIRQAVLDAGVWAKPRHGSYATARLS